MALSNLFYLVFFLNNVIPSVALMQKAAPKNQSKWNPLIAFIRPHTASFCIIRFIANTQLKFCCIQLFQMPMPWFFFHV
jgi:hypothetical protein